MINLKLNVKTKYEGYLVVEKLKRILYHTMTGMQDTAVRLVPVDTGRLKNSINLTPQTPGSNEYVLHDGVDYGVYQEFGTIKMGAQPFFRPALQKAKNKDIPRLVKKEFG